jgi:hypothetical protein
VTDGLEIFGSDAGSVIRMDSVLVQPLASAISTRYVPAETPVHVLVPPEKLTVGGPPHGVVRPRIVYGAVPPFVRIVIDPFPPKQLTLDEL